MKILLSLLLGAAACLAQNGAYVAYKATTLSGAAEKITIQQVTGSKSRQVQFKTASVYCSVACTITLTQNGTAATATALSITPVNTAPPSLSAAFSSSDAAGGSTLGAYVIPAGGTLILDLSPLVLLRNAGSGSNFSIGTNSITGDVKIQINWMEAQ